jgi:hypothetical protein
VSSNSARVRFKEFPPRLKERLERGFEKYRFSLCEERDWERVRSFIGRHWNPDHVYCRMQELVVWQQRDAETGNYNFVFAEDRSLGEIHSIQAFIPNRQFDNSLKDLDLWPGLILAVNESVPGLGSQVLRFLLETVRPRSIGGFGISREAARLYPKMGLTMGWMNHHYLLNPEKNEFHLADPAGMSVQPPAVEENPPRKLRELVGDAVLHVDMEAIRPEEQVPAKSARYLYNRYARHPVYRYALMTIEEEQRPIGLLVYRVAEHQEARAVRMVDFVGQDRAWLGLQPELLDILQREDAEYLDLYSLGLDMNYLKSGGLRVRMPDDPVIIPTYFEPFVRKNVVLDWAHLVPPGVRYRMFKGDSDQDRPGMILPVRSPTA